MRVVATVADLSRGPEDAALEQMVVVGHSQGGLLTKLQAVDSGNSFWENISDQLIDEAGLSEETRAMVDRAIFFEALPFVARVLFLATPHGGSYLASFRLSSLATGLITLPLDVVRRGAELLDTDENRGVQRRLSRMPTSIDNMSPGSPFLRVLPAIPIVPGVAVHSIIPVKGDGPVEGGDDGVVKYQSAHIDGVDSELIVRSPHSTQSNPRTIDEVRRILQLHADTQSCRP